MNTIERYRYVAVLRQKADNALSLFTKVLQTTGRDSAQIKHLNEFIKSYCDIFYYIQENVAVLKDFEEHMDNIASAHEQVRSVQSQLSYNPKAATQLEHLFRTIVGILQDIQRKCVDYKI